MPGETLVGIGMLGDALDTLYNRNQAKRDQRLLAGMNPIPSTDPSLSQGQGGPDQLNVKASGDMMSRAKQYLPLYQQAAKKYFPDNPEALSVLMGIGATESQFDFNARNSTSGAVGGMQFLPSTAKQYGVNPFNPASAIDGAAHLLSDNLKRCRGDMNCAVNAYNMGFGRGINHKYLAEVNGYAKGPFSNFGSTGGAPSEAGAAGATPSPGEGQDTSSPEEGRFRSARGMTASADSGQAFADVAEQQAQYGVPKIGELPGDRRARLLWEESQRALGRKETAAVGARGAASEMQGAPFLGPAGVRGRAAASEMQGSQGLLPLDVRARRAASGGPDISGAGGTQAEKDAKGPPSTNKDHSAHSQEEMVKADAADPDNPPKGPPLDANGFFPYYNPVWGKGFTLPQLLYNLKRANPNISPEDVGRAIQLAIPMLNSAAQENYHDTMLQVREDALAQGKQLAEEKITSAEKIAKGHDETRLEAQQMSEDTKLKIRNSLSAYQEATLPDKHALIANRILTNNINTELKTADAYRKEKALELQIERVKQGDERISLEQAKKLAADYKEAVLQRHQAMTEKIQTAGNQYMSKETKKEMQAIEDDEFQQAQDKVKEMEKQLKTGNTTPAPSSNGGAPPISIDRFLNPSQ